jgi:solute carrier family 25 carnitine/acylcarnitine transporter 20/29
MYIKPSQVAQGTSSMHLIRAIVKTSGVRGLFTGFFITALRDVPGYGVYFATYEAIRRHWIGLDAPMNAGTMSKLCVAGAMAGVVGWLPPLYQFDMIKSRMQTQSLDKPIYRSSVDCFQQIIQKEGTRAMFRGMGSAMLRAIPVNAVTFAVYEAMLTYLHQPIHL